ncbi:hypothetical protein L0P96_15400 [Anoxybacillus flavithermus]
MLFCMRGHKHHKHHDHHSSDHHSIKELQDQITKLQTDNERLKEQLKSTHGARCLFTSYPIDPVQAFK